MTMTVEVLAGIAFMFSSSILLQILACAVYSNWWPLLSALMYVLVPMPCLFFGGGSTQFLLSRDGGGWLEKIKVVTFEPEFQKMEILQQTLKREVKKGDPAVDILEINRLRRQLLFQSHVGPSTCVFLRLR